MGEIFLLFYLCISCTAGVLGKSPEIIQRDRLPQQHSKLACPGYGPFATLSSCFIVCDDSPCSNAVEICSQLRRDCSAVVRSSLGVQESLAGQLVELVSLAAADDPTAQHRRSCLQYGQQLAGAAVGERVARHEAANRGAVSRFVAGNGTIMFLHFRKSGGTTLCRHAAANQLVTPPIRALRRAGNYPFLGKNCNPSYLDVLSAWFGTVQEQVQWADSYSINFFANELFLPELKNIPFGKFVVGTQLRHPSAQLYSLFRENLRFQSCPARVNGQGCSVQSLRLKAEAVASDVRDRFLRRSVRWDSSPRTPGAAVAASTAGGARNNTSEGAPCRQFDRKRLIKWLQTLIRSQEVASIAGMRHADGYLRYANPEHYIGRITDASVLQLLHAGIKGVNYNDTDLEYAKDVLERFSFVSILEGVDWLMEAALRGLRLRRPGDIRAARGGTRHTCGLLEHVSHDAELVAHLLAVSNLDFELYAHAVQVACIKYYHSSVSDEH